MNKTSVQCIPPIWTKVVFGGFSLMNVLFGIAGGLLLIASIVATDCARFKAKGELNQSP